MLLQSILSILTLWITLVSADVSISKPLKGETYTVEGNSVTVPLVWIESNTEPKLDEITQYSFLICTGPNDDINGIEVLKKLKADEIDGNSYDLVIPADTGADGNYYVQIYAQTTNGYSIHYSYRFALEGMTGSLVPSGADPNPPNAEVNLRSTNTQSPGDTSKSFTMPYTAQTGRTRYAPMQTQPGSRVTASSWSRRFPTSAVTYYTSASPSPAQFSTVTPGWSYTLSSAVNWASVAGNPSDHGGWYHPSSRLQAASITRLTGASPTSAAAASSSSA